MFEGFAATVDYPGCMFWRGLVQFYPSGDRIHDRDFVVAAFNRHNEEVESLVPQDRLLVYEVAQGWSPLCKFLEVPVPDAPFPRVNSREERAQLLASRPESAGERPLDLCDWKSEKGQARETEVSPGKQMSASREAALPFVV